jgi:hypothetical protein
MHSCSSLKPQDDLSLALYLSHFIYNILNINNVIRKILAIQIKLEHNIFFLNEVIDTYTS